MVDRRLTNLAKILVNYSTEVANGDLVFIQGNPLSLESILLIRETFREILKAGGHPYVSLQKEGQLDHIFYEVASDHQLDFVDPLHEYVIHNYNCEITVLGASSPRYLAGVDPKRLSRKANAYGELTKVYMDRAAHRELRWVYVLYPTSGFAQDAEMSSRAFEDFVFSSAFADRKDPKEHWIRLGERNQQLIDFLAEKESVRILGENVDQSLSIKDRKFHSADGRVNVPDGEIYTAPVEDSLSGWVTISYPAIWEGTSVEGIQLHFKEGRVTKASASKNEEFLRTMIAADEGASRVGEFAFGTNPNIDRFMGHLIFDEKILGTFHLALGFGYPDTGSKNKSPIHWDMVFDLRQGAHVYVDDELFNDSGSFVT